MAGRKLGVRALGVIAAAALAAGMDIVVGGSGTVTVVRDGKPATLPISGPPAAHQIVAGDQVASGTLEVRPSKGLQVFSFTYG